MGWGPPGSSVHEIFRQEYRSGVPFPTPVYLPHPGIEPGSPALAGESFTTEPPGKLNTVATQAENYLLEMQRSIGALSHTTSSPDGPETLGRASSESTNGHKEPRISGSFQVSFIR